MFKSLRRTILFGRASGLALKGRYPEAKKAIDKCFELGMEEDEILGNAIKGEIEYQIGNLSEAEKSLKIVLNDIKENPNDWSSPHSKQILERVNYYWGKLINEKT